MADECRKRFLALAAGLCRAVREDICASRWDTKNCSNRRDGRRISYAWLMSVEPFVNVRDGILVERPVETARYVTDMRRRQYVVERPARVRRRQRLNVEYVDRRAGDSLVL